MRIVSATARLLARLDQLQAAAAEAAAAVEQHGAERVVDLDTVPAARTVVGRLRRGVIAGTIKQCQHLRGAPPGVMVWLPARPALVRCRGCAEEARVAIRDDPAGEDFRCDHCGTRVETIARAVANLGPVLVLFGLCSQCSGRPS